MSRNPNGRNVVVLARDVPSASDPTVTALLTAKIELGKVTFYLTQAEIGSPAVHGHGVNLRNEELVVRNGPIFDFPIKGKVRKVTQRAVKGGDEYAGTTDKPKDLDEAGVEAFKSRIVDSIEARDPNNPLSLGESRDGYRLIAALQRVGCSARDIYDAGLGRRGIVAER